MVHHDSVSRKIFNVFNILFFLVIITLCLYPLWYIFVQSLSSGPLAVNAVAWPINFTLKNYADIFKSGDVPHAFLISVLRTSIGTACTLLACMLLGYLFSKEDMPLRKVMYRILIITMYVSGGLIPTYLVYKAYRLTNSFLVYILPAVVDAYYVILIKTYVEQLPISVEESAMIDGAGTMCIFLKIILPMSLPIVATIAIYASVGQWNSWFDNHIYAISNKKILTLQYMLYRYLQEAESIVRELKERDPGAAVPITPRGVRMTVTMITVVPVLCIYPFFQRYLIKGLMIGAVKG
ncbi:MAG: carbohydrate ABC transporter permease [Clostridiales bacterium]|nr:carbohydrate ABC transporter permease [Eubacteriales bacterium]MCI5766326.1 carbohydrate ABC transporter permease [Clostridiales bacterium]MDD7121582.1 carbohydrate ABC transporter permease [Clostridiales bacterium]MDY5468792.1 carbohydrate ABC transporter permease [Eubacteriales bacterium]